MVTHVHGAVGVGDESDGYAEAWYLPAARNIPAGYATVGTWYDFFRARAAVANGATWGPGFATFQYPNLNRASTIWYHDHTLGMTRLNVYAGPAGFYIVRGGPTATMPCVDTRSGRRGRPARPRAEGRATIPSNRRYYEIPIAIQDRSFNADGSLFYPDTREFFDGITGTVHPGQGRPSRRSGTRSSSGTRSWSTATPGRTRRWRSGATGSGSSTAARRGS